jgi:tetratricopeptide (TPR) repeat protein
MPEQAPVAAHSNHRWSIRFWVAAAVGLVTFAVFFSVLKHWFVFWDDDVFIIGNPELNPPTLAGLARIWANPWIGYNQFFVPINYTLWWIIAHFASIPGAPNTHAIFLAPAFHAINLCSHVIASICAFLILRKLVKSDFPAAVGALFFALHPLQAEPVSWAANMYTPLSGALALGALLAYLSFSDAPRGFGRWIVFTLGTFCFLAALLSKPSVVLLPFIAAALELFRGRKPRALWPLLAWLLLGAADAIVTHHVQSGNAAFHPPLWKRPFIAGDALAFYLGKVLLPFNLVPDYGRSPEHVLQSAWLWWAWLIPAATIAACWTLRKRAPWLWCGAIIFVLGVLPMLGLVPFDFQSFSTVADRYVYLSLLGAAMIVSFATQLLASRAKEHLRGLAHVAPLAIALALGAFTVRQVGYWEDTGVLFHHTLEVNPHSQVAHLQLAYVLLNRGGQPELEESLDHYQAVLDDRPHDPRLLVNIGIVLRRLGRPTSAAAYFDQAWHMDPSQVQVEYMLADALFAAGDRRGAITAFSDVFRRQPDFVNTEIRLAQLLAQSGDTPAAIAHYKSYLRTHPTSAEARMELAHLQTTSPQAATDPR